jgi:hypothetical protein
VTGVLPQKIFHFALVMLIYGCTGSATAFLSAKLTGFLGIQKWSAQWWLVWLVLVFPLYNILLLGFAFVFGKYSSFRARQLMIIGKLKSWVRVRDGKADPVPPAGQQSDI